MSANLFVEERSVGYLLQQRRCRKHTYIPLSANDFLLEEKRRIDDGFMVSAASEGYERDGQPWSHSGSSVARRKNGRERNFTLCPSGPLE